MLCQKTASDGHLAASSLPPYHAKGCLSLTITVSQVLVKLCDEVNNVFEGHARWFFCHNRQHPKTRSQRIVERYISEWTLRICLPRACLSMKKTSVALLPNPRGAAFRDVFSRRAWESPTLGFSRIRWSKRLMSDSSFIHEPSSGYIEPHLKIVRLRFYPLTLPCQSCAAILQSCTGGVLCVVMYC